MSILDLWRGKTTLRELCWRTSQLGPESRIAKIYQRELEHSDTSLPSRPSSIFDWDQTQHMLADLIDNVQWANCFLQVLIQKDTKNPKKIKDPKPYPRPGQQKYSVATEKKKFATASDLKNLWG